jgi:hypothetical protein
MMLTKNDENVDSVDKERCPKSGEFVRIYLEAGFVPAFVDLEVDIYLFCHSPGRIEAVAGMQSAPVRWIWQLTHEPSNRRKTFVMEWYSSFEVISTVSCGFNLRQMRNKRSIGIYRYIV